MYLQWQENPSSVESTWSAAFSAIDKAGPVGGAQSLADCTRLLWLIQAFEERGNFMAQLDPLDYFNKHVASAKIPSRRSADILNLSLEKFGFSKADYDRPVNVGFIANAGGIFSTSSPTMTIKELYDSLVSTYCSRVGYEYSHIEDHKIVQWMRDAISNANGDSPLHKKFTDEERKELLKGVAEAVLFEDLLARKYQTKKRFGLDGGEAFIVGMSALLEESSLLGVEEAISVMAHRGRLNSLLNLYGKPLKVLLKEFKGVRAEELAPYTIQSDVKYHLGSRTTRTFGKSPKPVTVELVANPSHLEAANPVVQGKVKASQVFRKDELGKKVLPIEVHGDAAFAGQGVTFETMAISEIGQYHTGGTIHIVVNNQIGFTTDPLSSRSTDHCTDLGRLYGCPIFHVNGDCPEDVVRVFRTAAIYRATFNRSVVIDLVCYRRNGHNESDVPSLTQPLLYSKIATHPDILTLYGKRLIEANVLTNEEYNTLKKAIRDPLNKAFDEVNESVVDYGAYLQECVQENWKGMALSNGSPILGATAVTEDALAPVIKALDTLPDGFAPHPTIGKIIKRRSETLAAGAGLEWGTAEALAFGTLLQEGYHVHVSGQDAERATFSQRHSVLHDQNNGTLHVPLSHISAHQSPYTIINSPLSEYGAVGFETGYALHDPKILAMWEAQFGDFANGAQIMFDQFLSAGETKWNAMYAPIISLPHGYDGQGPEHSSARLERFLQLCSEPVDVPAYSEAERHHKANMEVTTPSTPAQYFHLLRRHVLRNFRKPLINLFSKGYLREVSGCNNTSTIAELCGETKFQAVIGDTEVQPSAARKVVFCGGQVYHKLYAARTKAGAKDVALVRIEQLSPFPVAELQALLAQYEGQELVWCQEEPQNMGAYWFVDERFDALTKGKRGLRYVGRPASASPATGYKYAHDHEQEIFIKAALQ
eukprot:GILI01011679.1.p1 GENE.GILI01011679.1~~GILI01011679.1.p1  ORF type:complete len:945 (-),score=193.98 GILI01011679.1:114-2918(-)